jgi:membrane associated rhomboid family serine protease
MQAYSFNPGKRKSFLQSLSITSWLIIINVFMFFIGLSLISSLGENFFSNYLAIKPSMIFLGTSLWTFLTSMFFHANLFHLFANMFSLFFVGKFLEKLIGKRRFLGVYIISGLVGGLFYVLASLIYKNPNIPAVGASGALFGLVGVLAVLVPKSRIYLIAGPLVLLLLEFTLVPVLPETIVPVFSMIINILFFVMIFAMFSFGTDFQKFALPVELPMWLLPIIAIVPLVLIDLVPGIDLPIGNSAHFGGLVVGLIYGFHLRKKFPRKIEQLGRMFR